MWVDVADIVSESPPSEAEIRQGIDYLRRGAKVRFFADENFPDLATRMLRRFGAAVVTVQELGLQRHPDENHAAYALRNGYVLVTCDRDYLDNQKFPLVHCPAIAVFNFGGGSPSEILAALQCLRTAFRLPQFYDKWMKIDATRESWIETARYLNGTSARTRYRWFQRKLQEWVEE
jgi:predicted nuclease of predicted toxin-antitoxin system